MLVGTEFTAFAAFPVEVPEEKGFNWWKLLVNVLAGLAVVALVAAVIVTGGAALVAVGAVAATTVSAVATGALVGGVVAVGFTAGFDILSGEVSDISEYMFSGLSGAVTGAISGGINLLKLGKFAKYGLEAAEGFITGAIENVSYQMLVGDAEFGDINWGQVAFNSGTNGAIAIGTPVIGKIPFVKKLTDKLTGKVDDLANKITDNLTGKVDDLAKIMSGEAAKEAQESAETIIANRTKGLDLNPHPSPHKQLSSKKMKVLKDKIDNRTISKSEYEQYNWNKKISDKRKSAVKDFWDAEDIRVQNGHPTRNWKESQIAEIVSGGRPKFNGKTLQGHHSYSVSKYPHLAGNHEAIWPATFNEHFNGWHGGKWNNSSPGKPIVEIDDLINQFGK